MTRPTLNEITRATAMVFDVPYEALIAPNRSKPISRARWVAMYIARQETRWSYPQIGRHFHGMDHSTVIYGCKQVSAMVVANPDVSARMTSVRAVAAKLAGIRAAQEAANVQRLHSAVAAEYPRRRL